jgi:hypothetical protein
VLTKSDLQSLLQCPRKLWLERNKPELLPKDESGYSRRAMDGVIVGEKAREQLGSNFLWPRSGDEDKAAAATQARTQLSEAADRAAAEVPMVHANLYARADALIPASGGYILRETKASTFKLKKDKQTPEPPKAHYVEDVAIQLWVMEKSGILVGGAELNLLDTTWRYKGNNDYQGLFRPLNVRAEVDLVINKVAAWLTQAEEVLKGAIPETRTGKQCGDPYDCPFLEYCRCSEPPAPEHPIELLPDAGGKALARKLRENRGYTSILEPAPEELVGKDASLYRRIQKAHQSGQPILEPGAAKSLIALPYPRYFFDFEGIDFPVPQWTGFRPYEHAPFQWSCHIEMSPGQFQHAEFLDLSGNDPSIACIEQMREVINPYEPTPIVVYSATYERQRLEELAIRHPEYGELIESYVSRLFDLHPVVKNNFYHPAMRGRFSIKSVLPVIAPELDYGGLEEVQEGTAAQVAYLLVTKDPRTSPERKADLERKLRTYCRQDTWAMVEVAAFLAGQTRPVRPDSVSTS